MVVYSGFMTTSDTREVLDELATLATDTDELYSQYFGALQERNMAVKQAIRDGVTMYAIAKRLGVSETAVAKIRDSKPV